jgi:predicted TIM-barrel fold metal-dependent hydrolase
MRIDVHHHIVPPEYLAAARDRIVGTTPRPNLVTSWTPDISLEMMDATDVNVALTSVSVPGLWFGDIEQTRRLARICNDYAARMVADHPDRFGIFGMLPLPDVDGALREIEYACDTLKADGVGLFTNYGDKWLSDPAFTPVLEELNRRKAVAFVHPLAPKACMWMAGLRPSVMEFLFDTVRCMTSLIFSGAAKRFPDIKFIFCHSGGALPVMFDRIVRQCQNDKDMNAKLPEGPLPYFRRFHYEIATSAAEANLGMLAQVIPTSQFLFGLDAPFVDATPTLKNFVQRDFSAADVAAIESGNALKLFPRFARM